MITKIYAVFGAIFLIIMGWAWMGHGSVIAHNTLNGVLSLVVGVFGIIYLFIKIIHDRNLKKKGVRNANNNA